MGVDVFLFDLNVLTQTDENGFFQFDQDLANNKSIQFSKNGYANKVIRYKKDQEINIILKVLHVELDEIGIKEKYSILGNNKAINIEHKSLVDNFISSTSSIPSS